MYRTLKRIDSYYSYFNRGAIAQAVPCATLSLSTLVTAAAYATTSSPPECQNGQISLNHFQLSAEIGSSASAHLMIAFHGWYPTVTSSPKHNTRKLLRSAKMHEYSNIRYTQSTDRYFDVSEPGIIKSFWGLFGANFDNACGASNQLYTSSC